MQKEAFILLLEDSPHDAELIERELRLGGVSFVSKRLETEDAFAKAIQDSPPDLILSDFKLIGFDGLQALAMARQHCPDVPFVLISGVCGEDFAIEALTSGASDYVLKDRLYRLVPAVRHALELAERRREERAARETERKFFALTETLPAIVFVHQDGKFPYLNPAAEQILGYAPEELLMANVEEVIHSDVREPAPARAPGRQPGTTVRARYEFRIVTRNGQTRWLDCTATRIEFDGQPAVLGSAFDVTDQKRLEEALRASKERFDLFMQHLPGAAWMKDLTGRYVYANETAERVFQRRLSDLLGRTDDSIFPAATAAQFKENDRLAISSSKSVEGIETVPQPDGLHHSHVRKFPILGREGTPVLVGGVAFDITERLRAEEALRESEERFRLLVECASTAMLMVDSEGRIALVNSQLEKLFGYQRPELLGQPVELLLPRRYQSQHWQLRADFFRAPAARPMGAGRDLFGLRKDGTEVPVEIGLNPLRIAEQTFVLASIIDITERKQAEVLSAAFSTLGQELSVATTPLEAARTVVGVASDLLGWDACYLHLCAPEGDFVPVLAMDTVDGQRVDFLPATAALAPSPMMREIAAQGPQLINRETASDSPDDLVPFGDSRRRSASLMYVPIHSGPQVIGVLSLQSYTPHAYNQEHLRTLTALADHCSRALARITAAERLRQSEERNRALLDAIPDLILRLRHDGMILDLKAPKDADFSLSARELLGKALPELAHDRLVEPLRYYLERALQTGEVQSFEFQFPRRQEMRDLEARVSVCGTNEVLAIVRDVTERKRLEEEVLEISARERRRIGHDLHDGLGQYLAGIAVKAKILEEDLAAGASPHKPAAAKLVRLVNNAVRQARNLARGFDPIEVEASGLVPALQKLASETTDFFHVTCELHSPPPDLPVCNFIGLQLYRIAQEAINNAIRHGKPTRIEIGLATEGGQVRLRIQDDGRGFATDALGQAGMGLRIMQYRAHAIGGVLKVNSRLKHGTEIQCFAPTARSPGHPAPVGEPIH